MSMRTNLSFHGCEMMRARARAFSNFSSVDLFYVGEDPDLGGNTPLYISGPGNFDKATRLAEAINEIFGDAKQAPRAVAAE